MNAKPKTIRLSHHMDEDTISDLIGPICALANLNRSSDGEMNALIVAARRIKEREGFEVVTYKL